MTTKYIDQIRENYARVGHLTEVRGFYEVRYHVTQEDVPTFRSEVDEIQDLIDIYETNGCPDCLQQINALYEKFEAKWYKNRTSL